MLTFENMLECEELENTFGDNDISDGGPCDKEPDFVDPEEFNYMNKDKYSENYSSKDSENYSNYPKE